MTAQVIIAISILILFAIMVLFMGLGWWWTRKKRRTITLSPYTELPMRFAGELSYDNKKKVYQFFTALKNYDNPTFFFIRSAFCRETGRIFPNCVTWYGKIHLDWSFLQKRYPGHYVSWGSLSSETRQEIKESHLSLEGFQTEFSSSHPSPKDVEPQFAYTKPGPLYVDIDSYVLLGWKIVPDTELEVLIVQKPFKKRV